MKTDLLVTWVGRVCRKEIALNYLKGYFIIDLVSLLPFGTWGVIAANPLLTPQWSYWPVC